MEGVKLIVGLRFNTGQLHMKNDKEFQTIFDLLSDCKCISFGEWLLKAVIVHPGLTMEEYLRRFKDE